MSCGEFTGPWSLTGFAPPTLRYLSSSSITYDFGSRARVTISQWNKWRSTLLVNDLVCSLQHASVTIFPVNYPTKETAFALYMPLAMSTSGSVRVRDSIDGDCEPSSSLLVSSGNEWDGLPQRTSCCVSAQLLKKMRVIVIIQSAINAITIFILVYFAISGCQVVSYAPTSSGSCDFLHTSTSFVRPTSAVDSLHSEKRESPSSLPFGRIHYSKVINIIVALAFDPSIGGDRYLQYSTYELHSVQE